MHVEIAKTSSTPSHWHHRPHVGWAKLPDRRCTVHQHRLQATVRCSWSESSREMARLPAHARPSDPLGLANPPARAHSLSGPAPSDSLARSHSRAHSRALSAAGHKSTSPDWLPPSHLLASELRRSFFPLHHLLIPSLAHLTVDPSVTKHLSPWLSPSLRTRVSSLYTRVDAARCLASLAPSLPLALPHRAEQNGGVHGNAVNTAGYVGSCLVSIVSLSERCCVSLQASASGSECVRSSGLGSPSVLALLSCALGRCVAFFAMALLPSRDIRACDTASPYNLIC
ncbi:hypothetical protein L1887_58391 [Cichorium endivia]|nr:hypothetical protein L1887_58391 [Cichorium endivia]